MIVLGLTIILFKFGDLGKTASFSNLWTQGGFFPFGALGVLLTLQMVMFAYQGLELIGVSAGETENPEKVLPHAINSVVYWMLILYIGALLIIMSLVAWNRLSPETSPFVLVFEKIGIPAGAGIINFVVITAASSSCNSGIFSTGRMLYSLARVGQAPRAFGKVSSRNVPAADVTASATLMLIGVARRICVPEAGENTRKKTATENQPVNAGRVRRCQSGFMRAQSRSAPCLQGQSRPFGSVPSRGYDQQPPPSMLHPRLSQFLIAAT
jgi:amino acid transporter, AAT family